jgi:hypothetical protein
MPCGKHTTCWYFHPVAKITNSVTVAMASNGSVKYETRLVFSLCQGANPVFGAGDSGEAVELDGVELLIKPTFLKSNIDRCCAHLLNDEILPRMGLGSWCWLSSF